MCGRYALRLAAGDVRAYIEAQTNASVDSWQGENEYNSERGYNIPPRTRNPVILRGGGGGASEPRDNATRNKRSLKMENMQWGLIPHWMKHPPDSVTALKTINARDDTIVEGGSMWKSIRGRRRCIVVAEGFFEWLKKGSERIPYHVKRKDGQLMCFAGLWDTVTFEGEKESLRTYTIVTTNSNKQLAFLHDRMPVILNSPEDIATWLDTADNSWDAKVAKLLKPFEGELEFYVVPKEVGKVGQQSPDFLKPVAERKGNISSFFAKQAASTNSKTESKSTSKREDSPCSPAISKSPKESKAIINGSAISKKDSEADDILPLNPDEGAKVKPASQSISSQAKVQTPSNSASGNNRDEALVLDDDSSDGEEKKAQVRSGKKRKRSDKSKPVKSKASKREEETDEKGNARVTNYFTIEDD